MRLDIKYAFELDRADELAHFRDRFVISDPELIYLDGNSLGRLPKVSAEIAHNLVNYQWGDRLIRSWNEGWLEANERIGAKIAQLIGAQPDEVIVADSTSVNLFKLAVAALRRQSGRNKIITDNLNFPSDIYIMQGVVDLLGNQHEIEVVKSGDGIHGPAAQLNESLDSQTALLTLTHTVFKSGYTYNLAEMTAAAHKVGALTLFDLSHSVGSVPIDLNAANVDLAVGCTYKYVNGGPGAPAFLYIRRDLQHQLTNPISGWMGQRNMFDFDLNYVRNRGLRHFLTGTAPVLSLALIEPGIDLLLEAGMHNLRAKSVAQSTYLIDLWRELLQPLGFSLNSPPDPTQRGSHLSLGHANGLQIDLALIRDYNVLPDFRAPDNIRLGIAPLYNTFSEIFHAVSRLQDIVANRTYEKHGANAPTVT